jgi:uncharacterized membrane protein YgdD (TMEM256/DUF423 family)
MSPLAAGFGASAVLLGAFGAHGLKSLGADAGSLATWATASQYHLVHAVALLHATSRGAAGALPAKLFAAGITLFSGSLYALVLTKVKVLGAVTPVGGVLLAAAWASLARL